MFKDVSAWPETSEDDMKPDLAMYPVTDSAKAGYFRDMNDSTTKDTCIARTAWAWMTLPIEVKRNAVKSAFHFKGKKFLRQSNKGKHAQAQLAKYASQVMLRQHRTFVFVLYIFRTKARITRWDRTGCIVSTAFDFVKKPRKLLTFVYRLALMSRAELGYDTSATLADEKEITELTGIHHKHWYARQCAEDILHPTTRILHPIYKVCAQSSLLLYHHLDSYLADHMPPCRGRCGERVLCGKVQQRLVLSHGSRYPRICGVHSAIQTAGILEGLLAP